MEPIRIYGERAGKIKTTYLFIAIVETVEGRKVVKLVPITEEELCGGKNKK
jgi:hypothetical protein